MTERIWYVKLIDGTIIDIYARDPQDAVRKVVGMGYTNEIYGVVA